MSPELFSFDNENIGHGKRLPTTTSTSWELRSFNLLSLTIRLFVSYVVDVVT